MNKPIVLAAAGVLIGGVAAAAAAFFFLGIGGGSSAASEEPTPEPTPVHVEGKIGPHIVLESRVFNLRTEAGRAPAYLKLEAVIEFETSSEEWAYVLHGCVAAEGGGSACKAEEERLLHEFGEEIGSGRTLIADAVTSIVSAKTLAEISTPEGKEALRMEIQHAVAERIPEPHVTRVLFTDFVTQ